MMGQLWVVLCEVFGIMEHLATGHGRIIALTNFILLVGRFFW
jgi:hypothetical protein